jgi:hypothetical protein
MNCCRIIPGGVVPGSPGLKNRLSFASGGPGVASCEMDLMLGGESHRSVLMVLGVEPEFRLESKSDVPDLLETGEDGGLLD